MYEARPATMADVATLRDEYRGAADCQIVRDSILPRGLARPYLLSVAGETEGYAGLWTRHFPGRILEFFVRPGGRSHVTGLLGALRAATSATEIEVQSNLPLGRRLLDVCSDVRRENLLFEAGDPTSVERDDLTVRARRDGDEPGAAWPWLVARGEEVLGGGGWLLHYNPPYADIYMEVVESARGQGVGSYLVQELVRECRQAGWIPAARCDPGNEPSIRALRRGGMRPCGELLVGRLVESTDDHFGMSDS